MLKCLDYNTYRTVEKLETYTGVMLNEVQWTELKTLPCMLGNLSPVTRRRSLDNLIVTCTFIPGWIQFENTDLFPVCVSDSPPTTWISEAYH